MTTEEQKSRFLSLKELLDLNQLKTKFQSLRELSQRDDFWQDQEQAIRINQEIAEKEHLFNQLETLELYFQSENLTAADQNEIAEILENLEIQQLLAGPYDQESAVVSLHAGTGGVDAMDWSEMLFRMYVRFGQKENRGQNSWEIFGIKQDDWHLEIIDKTPGEEAGIKSATIIFHGRFAYGLLKKEAGVHRLVRLSPFNAKNLRQTSFALVEVLPYWENQPESLNIPESDLRIDVFRSSGHGGQSVNTTDSAVRITHLPTNITVSVQNERSQHQNKLVARKILESRLQVILDQEKKEKLENIRGEHKSAVWGNQIRSYVLQPYQLVKDHRTEYETSDVEAVLDGNLEKFIEAELKQSS